MKYETSQNLQTAAQDLRFLLNRGYRKANALEFVGNHYLLDKEERNYLNRSIFSGKKSLARKDKLVPLSKIKGKTLLIDGYNILITIESICSGDKSITISDDGVLRDINAVFGKYKLKENTEKALNSIFALIKIYQPSDVRIFYDTPVSFSGELSKLTEEIMSSYGVSGSAKTVENVDYQLVSLSRETGGVVATSDGAVMDKVEEVLDIPCFMYKIKKKGLSLGGFNSN